MNFTSEDRRNQTAFSGRLDNTFYADKLAGLRRKILDIQIKHDQTAHNTSTSAADLIIIDSPIHKKDHQPEVIQV